MFGSSLTIISKGSPWKPASVWPSASGFIFLSPRHSKPLPLPPASSIFFGAAPESFRSLSKCKIKGEYLGYESAILLDFPRPKIWLQNLRNPNRTIWLLSHFDQRRKKPRQR